MERLQIPWENFLQKLNSYQVLESSETLFSLDRGEEIYINYKDFVPVILYILVKDFGYAASYSIDVHDMMFSAEASGDMDDDTPLEAGQDVLLSAYINYSMMLQLESQLNEYNVYLGEGYAQISDITSRLILLKKGDFVSKTSIDEKIRGIYESMLPESTRHMETLSDISPAYIYVEDFTSYTEHHQLVQYIYQINLTSNLLFSMMATQEERQVLTVDNILSSYTMLKEDNYWTLTDENAEWSAISGAQEPTFNQVKRFYTLLCERPEEYIIVYSLNVGRSAMMCFALAFMNASKKPIFLSQSVDFEFCEVLKTVIYCERFTLVDKLREFRRLPMVGDFGLELNGDWLRVVQLTSQQPNLKFKVVKASDFVSLIQKSVDYERKRLTSRYASYFEILLSAGDRSSRFQVFDQGDINYFQVVTSKDGTSVSRWEVLNLEDIMNIFWDTRPEIPVGATVNSEEMNHWDDLAYCIVRLLEQLVEKYETIHTVGDLMILREVYTEDGVYVRDENRVYAGFGSLDLKYTANVVQYGLASNVLQNVPVGPNVLPLQLLYDYRSIPFLTKIANAYQAAKVPVSSLKVPPIPKIKDRYVDMLIYSTLGDEYRPSVFSWALMPRKNASVADYLYVDAHAYVMRTRWYEHAIEHMTSYGFRLLTARSAPITIWGTPNYENRGGNGYTRINVFWEVFKHLPKKKGE